MTFSTIDQLNSSVSKDFWDSLLQDIITSNQKLTLEDYHAFLERSFMFSLFFRGCTSLEMVAFQKLLDIKDYGYLVLIEFRKSNQSELNEILLEELSIHSFIKSFLKDKNIVVGPLIANRISLLVTETDDSSDEMHRQTSLALCEELTQALSKNFQVTLKAGIGSMQPVNSIYSSFIDSLSCIYYTADGSIAYYQDIHHNENTNFDYLSTEKHLMEAVRLRKTDAYDYFGLIMDWIRPLNDDTKRNKILEILVLSNHAMRQDNSDQIFFMNYTGYFRQFMELTGSELIEFAYQIFTYITSYVKPQSTIDYSNQIVKVTRDYLEHHYTEDISLEDVAEQVNISPQYFSKLIKKNTGFNFIDWLSMLRVKKAKELLTNSNLTVKEVCFMVGYKDPNYFSRIFKKRIGITPSEYVKTSSYSRQVN